MSRDVGDPAVLGWYLKWYLAAGVDEAIEGGEEAARPVVAAAVAAPPAPPEPPAAPDSSPPAAPDTSPPAMSRAMPPTTGARPAPPHTGGTTAAPPPTGGTVAAELAAACRDLHQLRAAVEGFEGCAFRAAATRTVFADGNPAAPLMLIGEAPGREEDLQGLPFVGRSGQLLDRMLAAIQRDRSSAYITNVIFWRPPDNRNPSDEELLACLPFVLRHIALARPKVVVAVGGIAAKTLFRTTQGITRLRGQWQALAVEDATYPATAIFHPAYLLRSPQFKREAWRDLLAIRARLAAP